MNPSLVKVGAELDHLAQHRPVSVGKPRLCTGRQDKPHRPCSLPSTVPGPARIFRKSLMAEPLPAAPAWEPAPIRLHQNAAPVAWDTGVPRFHPAPRGGSPPRRGGSSPGVTLTSWKALGTSPALVFSSIKWEQEPPSSLPLWLVLGPTGSCHDQVP